MSRNMECPAISPSRFCLPLPEIKITVGKFLHFLGVVRVPQIRMESHEVNTTEVSSTTEYSRSSEELDIEATAASMRNRATVAMLRTTNLFINELLHSNFLGSLATLNHVDALSQSVDSVGSLHVLANTNT